MNEVNPNKASQPVQRDVELAESIPGLPPFGPAFGCPKSLPAILSRCSPQLTGCLKFLDAGFRRHDDEVLNHRFLNAISAALPSHSEFDPIARGCATMSQCRA